MCESLKQEKVNWEREGEERGWSVKRRNGTDYQAGKSVSDGHGENKRVTLFFRFDGASGQTK